MVKTYAFLDHNSTATFCTESLAKELKINGCQIQLTTTTISSRNNVTNAMLIQNLRICDFDENKHVIIPQCFSIPSLSVSDEEIFAKADLSR